MRDDQRKITIFTPGKKYTGIIDIPNASLRTTDLLNSGTLFWRNPNEKSFDDSILMHDVVLSIENISSLKKFDKLQLRIPEIILYYDELSSVGDNKEKVRAQKLKKAAEEKAMNINLVTRARVNSFFDITGVFYGLFKSKTNHRFLPLSNVSIEAITRKQGKWYKKKIALPNKFIGVSTHFIEACSLSEIND